MSEPFFTQVSLPALVSKFAGPDVPLSAMLEIADRCNEKCIHCYQVQGEKGEMSLEEVCQTLDQLAEMKVLFLTLSGGEALLRRDFFDIVAHARKRGFVIKLYTNGLRVTEEVARRLHEHAIQEVQISLYSSQAEMHDWVTGVPGSWEKTVAGVRHLLAHNVPTLLKTPVMGINEDDADNFIALCKDLGVNYMFDVNPILPREGADRSPQALSASAEGGNRLRSLPVYGGTPVSGRRTVDRNASPCGACVNVHVEPNGEIRPCTQLQVGVGRAQDGLKSAYFSDKATFIRSIRWSDIRGCRVCELQPYCSRCHHVAQVEQGDALGPSSSACTNAKQRFVGITGEPIDARGELGPFREVETGVFQAFEDVETEDDRQLRARHPWICKTAAPKVETDVNLVRPGDLVQLRRPGRRPVLEQVPGATVRKE